ncbi:MAG: hypothetical protein RJA49_1302, partial [Actinomycetota bacterium]
TAAASVFFAAADLTVDASGNLIADVQCGFDLATNTSTFDIMQFSADGATATSLASALGDVKHLTVSGSTVYFADPFGLHSLSGGTLTKISADPATCDSDTGTPLAEACIGLPTALPNGNLLFVSKDGVSTSPVNGSITRLSARSNGPLDGNIAAATPLPDMTTSMAVDADGSLYFAPAGRNVVRSVTTAGTFGTVAGNGNGSDSTPLTDGPATSVQIGQVFSMTRVGTKSVLLVTGTQVAALTVDGDITRIAGDGTAGNVSSVDPLLTHLRPRAAAIVGTDTYVAVAHTALGNPCGAPTSGVCTDSRAIVKISGSPAVLSTVYNVTTGGQQQAFEDMASTPDGKLVLSTSGVPALLRFDPATATATTVPVPAEVAGGQLAIDASGTVFVLGTTELVKVSPANVVSVVDTQGGTDLGIDDAGNVFVSRFDTSVRPSANVIVEYANLAVPASWTPPVVPTLPTLVPSASRVGGTVTAVGSNLSGLTWMKVGTTPVSVFTPTSNTAVRFTVPASASGQVTAGTASATAAEHPMLTVLAAPTQVSAGASHTCARLADGKVACWGANSAGQLGTGTKVASAFPLPVSGLTGAKSVAAGGTSSCAVVGTGVKCWGGNAAGQLGRGNLVASLAPVAVLDATTGTALTGVVSVSTGNAFACAVQSAGTVKCWGQNTSGQLGDGTKVTRTKAVTVLASAGVPLKGVTAVAAGGSTACARLATGAVRCWGSNSNGQLGRGNLVASSYPVKVLGLDGVAAKATVVTVGSAHACAVVSGAAVRCWGANASGQLGDGTTTQRLAPVLVKVAASATLAGATTVTAGATHTCAIVGATATATVRCWGSGVNGRLGSGTTSSSIARLVSGAVAGKAVAVAAGGAHTVVISPSPALGGNGISGWGLNSSGQVGDGTATSRSVPTRSPTL